MNKRGLSRVVTTLMIILLVLVAIGIVWVVIRNIISLGIEGIFLERFTIDLKIKNAYVDENNIVVNLIKRKPGQGNLAGIKFIFSNGTNTESAEEDTTMEELEEKSFTFQLNELDVGTVETVSIAPIFGLDSGEERLGNIIDIYYIKKIEGEGNGEPNGEEPPNGGESCEPAVNPCEGWVCGNVQNGTCGEISCGTCTGENETCTNGVCETTCGGWWDGSYCWHVGAYGESCTTVCLTHGGSSGFANDDEECTVCKYLIGSEEICDFPGEATPYMPAYKNKCKIGSGHAWLEGANHSSYKRFCACVN